MKGWMTIFTNDCPFIHNWSGSALSQAYLPFSAKLIISQRRIALTKDILQDASIFQPNMPRGSWPILRAGPQEQRQQQPIAKCPWCGHKQPTEYFRYLDSAATEKQEHCCFCCLRSVRELLSFDCHRTQWFHCSARVVCRSASRGKKQTVKGKERKGEPGS